MQLGMMEWCQDWGGESWTWCPQGHGVASVGLKNGLTLLCVSMAGACALAPDGTR